MTSQMEHDFRRLYRERMGKVAEDIIDLCMTSGLGEKIALQIIAVESLKFVAGLSVRFTNMTEQDFAYFATVAYGNEKAAAKRKEQSS